MSWTDIQWFEYKDIQSPKSSTGISPVNDGSGVIPSITLSKDYYLKAENNDYITDETSDKLSLEGLLDA